METMSGWRRVLGGVTRGWGGVGIRGTSSLLFLV